MSLRGYVVAFAVAASSLTATACKEEPVDGIATARSDMQPLVDAACDWMFGCCSDGELVYQLGNFTADAGNCSERLLDAIESGEPLQLVEGGLSDGPAQGLLLLALSINQGRVTVNSAAVKECADETSSRECNVLPPPPDPMAVRCVPGQDEVLEVPCDPDEMFVGNQGVGEECASSFECQEGLVCAGFGVAGVCARRAEIGEFCFADAECVEGLICDYGNGKCAEGAKVDQACAFADALNPLPGTETIRCAEDLSCNPDTLLCVGGSCAPGAPCVDTVNDTDCPDGYFCTGDIMGLLFTCQLPGPEGVSCMRDDTCASGYCDFNIGGVCATLAANGEVCFNDNECASRFCDPFGGLCAPQVDNGQPCPSGNAQCAAGYCDFNTGNCAPYATEGGDCSMGQLCDPDANLSCAGGQCRLAPFPNGIECVSGAQCMSQVCFATDPTMFPVCTNGSAIGAPCSNDGTIAPCVVGSFCDIVTGAAAGTCVELLKPGQPCLRSEQCWGDCVIRYGAFMCDSTPAFDLGEVWCDSL